VDPAVNGTMFVLRKAQQYGVQKVVLTSSMAAITDHPIKVYTEDDWNEESSLTRNPYYYSKKLAEECAWNFVNEAKRNGEEIFDLVVINPVIVVGPDLSNASVNTSNNNFLMLLAGKFPAIMDLAWPLVDVRDVAVAHLLAMKNDEAAGRYICYNVTLEMKVVVEYLKHDYSAYKLPTAKLDCGLGTHIVKFMAKFQDEGTKTYLRTNLKTFPQFDNSKIKQGLGVEFRDVYQTINETCEYLINGGHVQEKMKKKEINPRSY